MRGPATSLRARAAPAAAAPSVVPPSLLLLGGARHRRALAPVAAVAGATTRTRTAVAAPSSMARARRAVAPPPAGRARRGLRVSAVAMSPISDGIDDGRIPVTIITGFLGSGKTTLLNNVLRNKAGRRIAVIENEFGEIDIDSELVARTETLNPDGDPSGAAAITVLSNGCLCCSVRGDLIAALNALWERRAEFDHIVIETTGLANPAPVIQSLYLDEDLPHRVRLDGVVTVVDAANAWRHLSGRQQQRPSEDDQGGRGRGGGYDDDEPINEAVEQVAYADRIVLNKVDLAGKGGAAGAANKVAAKGAADEEGLDALEARLRAVNELASVVRAVRGEVDVDYVLGVGGFDLGKVEEEVARVANPPHGEPGHVCGAGGGEDCGHDHHDHAHAHSHDHDHDHDHDHGHAHAESSSNPAHGEPGHVCGGGGEDCGHDHEHEHAHAHSHDHSPSSSSSSPPSLAPPSLAFRGARSAARITAARHDDRVSSLSISVEGEMDLEKVNYTMGALLEARSEDLFRMKGILAIQGMEQRYVFQAVHALFEGQPDRAWREGEPRVSRMVLIGRELDADAFREAFERCLVAEGGDRPSEAVKARVAEGAAAAGGGAKA